jgi:proteic killer suppression protein
MDMSFANAKIRKICTDDRVAQKELGQSTALVLRKHLNRLKLAACLANMRDAPGDYHELTQNRKGQIACSLSSKLRLVFVPANEPIPVKPDGGLDWTRITAIEHIEIVDYHS